MDVPLRCARLDVRFDFHGFSFYGKGVDCWVLAVDMNIPIGAARLDGGLDFHTYGFLS